MRALTILALLALAGCTNATGTLYLDRDRWACAAYVEQPNGAPACVMWVDLQRIMEEKRRQEREGKTDL